METDQFLRNTADVATTQILWVQGVAPSQRASAFMKTRRKEKDKAFLDNEREGHLGETNSERGRGEMEDASARYMQTARTGHKKHLSGRSPTNWAKESTKNDRGIGLRSQFRQIGRGEIVALESYPKGNGLKLSHTFGSSQREQKWSFYYKTNIVIPTCISDSALSLITLTSRVITHLLPVTYIWQSGCCLPAAQPTLQDSVPNSRQPT